MPEVNAEVGKIDVKEMHFPIGATVTAILAGKETTGVIKAEYPFHILIKVTTTVAGFYGVNKGQTREYTTSVPKSSFLCGSAWVGGSKKKDNNKIENEVFLAD